MLLMLAGCSDPPQLSMEEYPKGVLRIGKRTCQIECIGPDAKLLRSWRWTPEFPDLYAFEINQGTAGTYAMTETHSLMIVNTAGSELKVIFDKPIYEATTQSDAADGEIFTDEIVTPYRLTKDKSGKPQDSTISV